MTEFKFTIEKKDNLARSGVIDTKRGSIKTPAFMPIATQGSVKFTPIELIEAIGYELILSNNYHLLLRPGLDTLAKFDGVSNFMSWNKPVLTDSGGFQVMSLAKFTNISKKGVEFQSHIDGSKHFLTPENVIESQNIIKSDIQMVLDECTKFPETHENVKKSMELSLHWAERSKDYYLKNTDNIYGAQFGIIQGGVFEDLRKISIKENIDLDFHGYAIGGLAVGEGHEEMVKVLDYTTPSLPENKVRYLMGVGRPKDIVEAVYRGVDIFDCVVPTREGRHGTAYLGNKNINLRNSKFEDDHSPLDESSNFFVSNKYSKGYLHHLLKINDPLGSLLISIHNLSYYFSLMKNLRESIENNKLEDFRELFYEE